MMLRLRKMKPVKLLIPQKLSTTKNSKRLPILKSLIKRSKKRREMPELKLLSMHSMPHSGVFLNMKKKGNPMIMVILLLLLFQR